MEPRQLGKMVYCAWMSNMKYILELEEFSYRELGRNDPKYKTFKKHLMSNTYDSMKKLFEEMAELGILQQTDYEEDLKNGYRDTPSGGSGYVNSQEIDEWFENS